MAEDETVKEVVPRTVEPPEAPPLEASVKEAVPVSDNERPEGGWMFCEVVGCDDKTEERIWETLRQLKEKGDSTQELTIVMRDNARVLSAEGKRGEAYLWALITGKVFGLFGV